MRLISLSQEQFAIVDDEDYEFLMQWRWNAQWSKITRSFYAVRTDYTNGKTQVSMHRLLAKTPKGVRTDHHNHNTLDNQKLNLRICTSKQNSQNKRLRIDSKSGFKGVNKRRYGYRARIWVDGKNISLGNFPTPEEAHEAYRFASIKHFGEFSLYA